MPRAVKSYPLPPYRYLPGRNPHPLRHAGGHLRRADAPTPRNGTERLAYARKLFEARFYWEAHEAWETQWHITTVPADRAMLKTLIQLAAGHLKRELGAAQQAKGLYLRARTSLESCAPRRRVLGVSIARVESLLETALDRLSRGEDPHESLAERDQAVGRRRRSK